MTHPGATLDALRDAGHRVRLEGGRIMVAPPPTDPEVVTAIKANRDALLGLLRLEEEQRGWPAGEAAALAFWLAYNASVAARPEEARARREARKGKGTEADEEDLFQ